MRKNVRSLLCLLLVLAMVLSLAACGQMQEQNQEKTDAPEEHPDTVYTYESLKLDNKILPNGITPMVYTDEGFYGQVYDEVVAPRPLMADGAVAETEETASEETAETEGETETEGDPAEESSAAPNYGVKLFFVGYDGTIRELPAYQPLPAQEDPGDKLNFYSGSGLGALRMDPQGNLVAVENLYTGWFDGTEAEMKSDSPASWEKYRNVQEYYVRRLNEDGSEQECVKLDYSFEDTWMNFSTSIFTEDGTMLVAGDEGVFAFGPDGSLTMQISSADVYPDRILRLRDGSLGIVGWGDGGIALYPLDLEKKALGDAVKIPSEAYNPMRGDEKYDLYYVNGMYLYGYNIADERKDKLLNFLDVDINGGNLNDVYFREDGSLMCVLTQYRNEKVQSELVRIFQAPYDSVPHKETLTLAVIYGYDIYDAVVEFNRHSDKVRIQVRDYSEYNDEENEDYDAGRTKLITEIMSGQMPDLLCLNQMPYRQLAAKGLLEDLYPYLDSDKDYQRDDFFENVLKAMEVNGGLYQITSSFNVATLIGAASVVGDKPGWTYQQLQDALATMPEGCQAMDMYTTRGDLLQTLLCTDLNHYVDWANGKCNFESQDFIDMLNFTAQFPAELPEDMEWESASTRIAEGRQMLTTASLYSVDSMIWNDAQFGKDGCTYIGYPTNDGVGSFMNLETGYAMSSKCADKEAAWSFLRTFLDEETQANAWNGIPLSKKVYQDKLEDAMTVEYEKDENGEYVLDEKGEKKPVSIGGFWQEDGTEVQVYAMTQEQADKLWEAVTTCDKVLEQDDAIYNIVFEQAQAFYSGQKTAEEVARLIQNKVTIYVNEQR